MAISTVRTQGKELSSVFRRVGLSPAWEAVVDGRDSGSYSGAGLNKCWTGAPISIRMLHILDKVLPAVVLEVWSLVLVISTFKSSRVITIKWHHNCDNVSNYIINYLCFLEKSNF